MLKIAICDDEQATVDGIRKILSEYADKNKLELLIHSFTDATVLLQGYQGYDLIFLDIEMPAMNGIEAATEIRKLDKDCKFIYITNYESHAHKAISVRTFGYVIKPYTAEKIEHEMNDFLSMYEYGKIKHELLFKHKKSFVAFSIEDVYYFELIGKNRVKVSLGSDEKYISSSINDVYEDVKEYSFEKSHQSFIVNMLYVDKFCANEILMKNGEMLPIAQKRLSAFRKQHLEYVQNGYMKLRRKGAVRSGANNEHCKGGG